MWWMMLPSAPERDTIDDVPALARPAVMVARATNDAVSAAADAWLSAMTGATSADLGRAALGSVTPKGRMAARPFMSVETRDGETRVAVGQAWPTLPFVTLPRIDVPLLDPFALFGPALRR